MTLKQELMQLLASHPAGLTYEEMSEMTGRTANSVAARLTALKRAGLVYVGRTIPGDYGRPRAVYMHVAHKPSQCNANGSYLQNASLPPVLESRKRSRIATALARLQRLISRE